MSKKDLNESTEKIGNVQDNVKHNCKEHLACEEGQGICAHLMVLGSVLLILVTLPFSLLFVVKVVQVINNMMVTRKRKPFFTNQEYERAVIFRLGLLLSGGARGPGVFFIIPCVDILEIVDLRVQVFNVPPQEVGNEYNNN